MGLLLSASSNAGRSREDSGMNLFDGRTSPQQASRHAKTDPPAVPLGHRPYYFRRAPAQSHVIKVEAPLSPQAYSNKEPSMRRRFASISAGLASYPSGIHRLLDQPHHLQCSPLQGFHVAAIFARHREHGIGKL